MRGPRQVVWYEQLELEHPNLRAALDFCARTPGLLETGLRMGGALWWFWWRRTHQREGIELLQRLITATGDGEPSVGRAKALCGAGALAFHLGAFETSRQRLEQSVQVARELGDDALTAVALIHFAWPLTRQDPASARKVTEEGLSPDAYARAWTEGTSMTREEAIAFALDEDDGRARKLRTEGSGA